MARLYYLANFLYRKNVPLIPRFLMLCVRFIWGSFIPYQAKIGRGVSFGHGMGIVIARPAVIGERCLIRHQVTIDNSGNGAAMIGDDVRIGAGAKIIGPVKIGNRVLIGANAVVLSDVPDDVTVAGIPARIVRYHKEAEH